MCKRPSFRRVRSRQEKVGYCRAFTYSEVDKPDFGGTLLFGMAFENLSERERRILELLIAHYIQTADPVGSRVIASRYNLGISPATVRNTLQDLEEMGLLEQPHTSAGRVPTDSGYRVYVDQMLQPEPLSEEERKKIKREISADPAAVNRILDQTSRLLANLTHQLGLSVAPSFERGILTRIELVPVAERKILVIVAVKGGLARSILLEVDARLEPVALEETRRVLNERLCGRSLGEIRATLEERFKDVYEGDARLIKLFLDHSEALLHASPPEQIHLEGTANILRQPEFRDQQKVSALIDFLEEKKSLVEVISAKGIQEGIVITIGKETDRDETKNLSMVTSTYQVGDLKGTIGVIGPTRMPYSKLVSIVDYTAQLLTEILSE